MLEHKLEALTAAIEALTAALLAVPASAPKQETSQKVQVAAAPETKTDAPPEPKPAPAPSTGPTEQDVKDLTLARSREGHKDAIRDKLSGFGAKKIGDLKGSQTTEFYDWLKSLETV